jgi:hypothetical protein
MLAVGEQALRNHEDLFQIMQMLKENCDVPRSDLTAQHFSQPGKSRESHSIDQYRALNMAVRIMTSICCSSERQYLGQIELGSDPVVWRNDKSLQQFLESAFPAPAHSSFHGPGFWPPPQIEAARLEKVAGMKFHGTDDIKNHLRFDRDTGVLEIYHHVSTLKEHLRASRLVQAEQPQHR